MFRSCTPDVRASRRNVQKDRPGADRLRLIFMSSALCECKVFSIVPIQASSLQLTLAALTSRLRLVEIGQNEDLVKKIRAFRQFDAFPQALSEIIRYGIPKFIGGYNDENDDIEKSRNSAGRLCRVDDNGASGARAAGTVRRPPGFMDRLRQYRTFGRITGTAEVPSDISGC
jgi:hypothetical protein